MKRCIAIILLNLFCQLLILQDVVLVHAQKREKYTLAVLNFAMSGDGYNRMEINAVSSRLTNELAQTGYFTTMSNPDMELALRGTNIDSYECAGIACGLRAGNELGVQLIVIGTIVKRPASYLVTAQLLHISSGVLVKVVEEDIPGNWIDIQAQMPIVAKKLVGESEDKPVAAAVPISSAVTTAQYSDGGGGFKWYYAGLGLLVAGGVGLLLLNDSDSKTQTPASTDDDEPEAPAPTPLPLPGPPSFP